MQTVDTIKIRRYAPHMRAALEVLNSASFPPDWGEMWSINEISSALNMPGVAAILAFQNTQRGEMACGFLLWRRVLDETEILLLGVDQSFRRQGIAVRLIEHFLEENAQYSISRVFLEVRENNLAARSLYNKLGFQVVGERPQYYHSNIGKTYDAITFALPIS